jgi:hypothetical protein
LLLPCFAIFSQILDLQQQIAELVEAQVSMIVEY